LRSSGTLLVPQQTHIVQFRLACIDEGGAPSARIKAVLVRDPSAFEAAPHQLLRPVLSVVVTMPTGLSADEVQALEG